MSSVPHQVGCVMKGSLLELWRRQDVWILFLLMGVYTMVALGARITGDGTLASGTFMLNLGISLAGYFANGFTALIAIRQFPDEIENRTIYPLLAKPLTRDSLLIGKWCACFVGGSLAFLAFHLIALVVSPASEPISGTLHLQYLLLQFLSLGWIAAAGLLLSLILPRSLGLGILLLMYAGGESLFQWGESREVALRYLLPRFGSLNVATRLTDGIPALKAAEVGSMILYAVAWALFCFLLARHSLLRRSL